MLKTLTVFFLFTIVLHSQVEQSAGVNPYAIDPRFYLDFASYPAETMDKSRLDVFLKVPYSSIQFVRYGAKYKGAYSVTLTFYDEDKENIQFEKIWNEQIIVDDFLKTNSNSNFNISYRSNEMYPGTYFMRTIVEDRDSKRSFTTEGTLTLKEYKGSIQVSDVVFIQSRVNSPTAEQVIPNVSNIFTTRDEGFAFFYEILSDTSTTIAAKYKIFDAEEEAVLSRDEKIELTKGENVINQEITFERLSLGQYQLNVELYDENDELITGSSKKFLSKIYGFPNSILDLDEAIKQMMYIASSDELDSLQAPESFDEKLNRYVSYWGAKDPSPNTEENEVMFEYYRRVAYSNTAFESYYPGWKTDMGMIYITLGAPDQVDRHPFDYNSKPYEVWDYYDLNKRFIFVDETGFGDYRLLNPVYGDWYRYRY
ncbi:MAG: hypothetical protein SCALA702_07400 [Melioribacteraceae bacterium]|nr:MAG: hypothetical protein SCALA702_07400 [Melioribacteraceae bacterium]